MLSASDNKESGWKCQPISGGLGCKQRRLRLQRIHPCPSIGQRSANRVRPDSHVRFRQKQGLVCAQALHEGMWSEQHRSISRINILRNRHSYTVSAVLNYAKASTFIALSLAKRPMEYALLYTMQEAARNTYSESVGRLCLAVVHHSNEWSNIVHGLNLNRVRVMLSMRTPFLATAMGYSCTVSRVVDNSLFRYQRWSLSSSLSGLAPIHAY